jgi:LmbE family N-acetylglucosaminyl deacetylase
MRERLAEDRAALAVAGAESVSLGLLEAQYRDGEPDTAALDAALDAAVRDRGEVWAPAGIGAHPDHAAVRRWALALAASGGARVRLYAELPYAVRHGWPGWVIGQDEPAYFAHDAWWEAHLPQGVALAPAAHGLDADEVELKLRALAEYRTQLYAVDGGPAGLVTGPATRGFELSWAVGA